MRKKSLRIMYFLNCYAYTSALFKEYSILTLADKIVLENCLFTYKYFNKALPTIFCEFKDPLSLATKELYFIFNNILYKQIDGVALGSPLGSLLANAILSFNGLLLIYLFFSNDLISQNNLKVI